MTSLFKGKSWTKFEMDSLGSPSLRRTEERKGDFVSFETGRKEEAHFIPIFQEDDDNHEKTSQKKKSLKEGFLEKERHDDILTEMRREAEEILGEAQEKAALLEREAYEKGFAQGEKDGLEFGEKKALKVIENIEKLFLELNHQEKAIVEKCEREILEVIFAIAKKIIHSQIRLDGEAVKETLYRAVDLVTEKSSITVRVNPEDLDCVERLRPEFLARFRDLKSLMVKPDPSITRGGCRLESAYGDVDARVETQLEKIYQALEGAFDEKEDGSAVTTTQMG